MGLYPQSLVSLRDRSRSNGLREVSGRWRAHFSSCFSPSASSSSPASKSITHSLLCEIRPQPHFSVSPSGQRSLHRHATDSPSSPRVLSGFHMAFRFRYFRGQLKRSWGLLPESQGHNLALTILFAPCSLDSSRHLSPSPPLLFSFRSKGVHVSSLGLLGTTSPTMAKVAARLFGSNPLFPAACSDGFRGGWGVDAPPRRQ